MARKERICVLGLGYIGLPTAALFASSGYEVIGVDINAAVVSRVNRGEAHDEEPGLAAVVREAVESHGLSAQLCPTEADAFIIAVPTPCSTDKRADLGAVIEAAQSIVPHLRRGNLVILESTVPPGTTEEVVQPILERSGLRAGRDLHLAHSPERVLPGNILAELVKNDRVVGGIDQTSAERTRDLYVSFVSGQIFLTDATTAELVKLMENTYRDVNIALANTFARIGEVLGVDVWQAIALANRHPRVNILTPGPGVGGHCIAVDPWFIVEKARDESRLIEEARLVNDSMPLHVAGSILELLAGVSEPRVAILGVSYKANVRDARESPALCVARLLAERGCDVRLHDPYVCPDTSLIDAVGDAHCLALLVDHREYASLDPEALGTVMQCRTAFDARNQLPLDRWHVAGFRVRRLGQGVADVERPTEELVAGLSGGSRGVS